MELKPIGDQHLAAIELSSVLDELRVLLEPSYREAGIEVVWRLHDDLPLVTGDRYGLAQVFLNLSLNSHRAMQTTVKKQLAIRTAVETDSVVIRFEDTGVGVSVPKVSLSPFSKTRMLQD